MKRPGTYLSLMPEKRDNPIIKRSSIERTAYLSIRDIQNLLKRLDSGQAGMTD